MSPDEAALIRLWQEKRGEAEPADLSGDLIVQLGVATEALNRSWYERNTGRSITDVQRWAQHPVHRYLAATLDGFVNALDAVFEAKFMLPWSFSEEAAIEKHVAQLQHNMWVTNARSAALSIITGGGKWVEMTIPADALVSAFSCHRRASLLALCSNRRDAKALWHRTAAASRRSGSRGRHEQLEFVGGVCRLLLRNPLGLSRP